MKDEQLVRDVGDELHWDPKVDSRAIAISASAGKVTLRGTVGSPWERHEAKRAAQRVRGVVDVDNRLEVRILDNNHREDADLRGDVLQALMLDSRVPATVDATVKNGVVTLTGRVDWWYQREEADFVASNVSGVASVVNHVVLREPTTVPSAADVETKIRRAFARNARLDADAIHVTTTGERVTLHGTVRSWDEHHAALDAAWSAPGVQAVDDRLTIAY